MPKVFSAAAISSMSVSSTNASAEEEGGEEDDSFFSFFFLVEVVACTESSAAYKNVWRGCKGWDDGNRRIIARAVLLVAEAEDGVLVLVCWLTWRNALLRPIGRQTTRRTTSAMLWGAKSFIVMR